MIIARIICLCFGYLIGTFQTGFFYGKSKGIDIREHGSGNSGTTNTLRILGWKAGLITFAGDCLKAVAAVLLAACIYRNRYPEILPLLQMYAGFGAVLGHNFPFYMHFRGGKGIACTAGVVLAVCPIAAPAAFLFFAIPLAITRYVSLGSLLSVSTFFIEICVFAYMGILGVQAAEVPEFIILCACFTGMAFWRHRANIVRLLNGTENKLGAKAKK